MATPATLRTIGIGLIALATLVLATHLVAPPAGHVFAQDGGTATTAGELVVAPGVVEVGQTTLAVGFHVVPMDLEVVIEYSEHFTPEGEACDNAGIAGATETAVAPTWVTLNACTVGKGYVRMVESETGELIENVSVTVDPPGAPRQQAVSVTIDDLASGELVPDGAGDRFSVSAAGLEAHREHNLHTVVLNSLSAAFNRGCTTFRESDSIVGHTSAIEYYTVYGCVAPGNYVWSYVEEVGGTTLASSGLPTDNPVNVADPKVSFKESLYSVDEGSEIMVTVKLSHSSSNNIEIPITFGGTAGSEDYVVEGLSSDDRLTFTDLSTSEEFTIVTTDDDNDEDDETVNLRFGTPLPSTVMGSESPSSATVTIIDDDEVPVNIPPDITGGRSSVSYDEGGTGTVETYSASDPDGDSITWSLRGTDRFDFDISDDGELTFRSSPDYEDPHDSNRNNIYTITVRASDGSLADDRNVTVTVNDVNERPDVAGPFSPSYDENGTGAVATYTADDPEDDDITWSLRGTDRFDFDISDDGELTFRSSPDYEDPDDSGRNNIYTITVRASDGSLADDRNVTVTVNDVNERPDVAGPSSPSYDENGTGDVATYTADDPEDDDITWSLPNTIFERDRLDFRISSSGVLTFRSAPDFESPHDSNRDNEYRITVRASDGRLTTSVNVAVTVTNVNERPSVASAIADQTLTAGDSTTVSLQGRFSDPDGDTLTYTAATSASTIATAGVRRSTLTLTAVSAGSATITVTAADRSPGHVDRLTVAQDFTVTVDETNAEPTFDEGETATRSVAENAASSIDAGNPVNATDHDNDTLTYELSGTDAGSFTIVSDSGQIRTSASLDFETKNSYSVTVTVEDDNGGSDSIDVTINVTDVNERPDVAGQSSPSYDENGTGAVGTYTADDPEDDDITWSLRGTDRFDFDISDDGELTFRSSPDYEDPDDSGRNNEYEITVRASDGSLADTMSVTITVTNVNERPQVERPIPDRTLAPGVASREIDLSHYFSDPDGDTLIYTAASDAVGVATTRVRGNTLTLERVSAGSATITVTAADRSPGNADRLTASQAFGVTVDETNVPPTFVEDDPATRFVAENTPSNTNIGNPVRASDEDVDDTLTYSLSGTDAGSFAIDDDNGQILTSDPLDFETKNSYSVTVTVDDGNGGTATIDVTITVVNVAPTITSGPHWVDYDEGDTVSAGDYDASDPGGGDISWSLSGTDAGDFRISGSGVLRFRSTPDFENPRDDGPNNEYEITVNASDGDLADSLNVTISVNNLAPTITSGDDRVRYDENRKDAVKNYEASDPGGGDVSWSIPSKSAGTDKHDFEISRQEGVLTFDVTPDFENPHDEDIDNVYTFKVRASDASGNMADLDVTIEVTDVDEPPGRPSRPTVISNGETSLNVEWSAPTNTGPPINDYDVQYRVGSSGRFTSAAHTGTATQTTISDLDPDSTYEVQVRARNAEGTSAWSQSGTGSTDAPVPTVTIAPLEDVDSVGEGQLVPFTLTAKPAPTTELKVKVSVTETGSFLTGPIPTKVTIGAGSETALLTLQTSDDAVDEANGTVTAIVRSGADYEVGSPSSAEVTVRDDDKPPVPTGLRANGDLDGGNVTLRWNAVAGATGYMVRYTEEDCDSDGVCDPDDGSWDSRTYTAGTTGTVIEADLGGLSEEQLYRVEVRAVIVDDSDWSEEDFTLVFPTDSAPSRETEVATAPFHGYQAKNAQGSHEFRYVLCEETIPAGLDMTALDMKDAVDEWEDTVTWSRAGANIITTTAYALPSDERCSTLAIPTRQGRFEMKFASSFRMGAACNPLAILPIINAPPACWRSTTWEATDLAQIDSGSLLLNADRVAANWNRVRTGCSYLRHTIVHEGGHAFGIGNQRGIDYNRHPTNQMHSVMSYDDRTWHCKPQAYDIVALMALYQSQ